MLMAHPYNPNTGHMAPPLKPGAIGIGDRSPLVPQLVGGFGEEVIEPEATLPRPSAADIYDARHMRLVNGLGQDDATVAAILQELVTAAEGQRKSLRNISMWVGIMGGLTVAGIAASIFLTIRGARG